MPTAPENLKNLTFEINTFIHSDRSQEALARCYEALALDSPLKDNSYLLWRAEIYGLLGDILLSEDSFNESIAAYLNSIKLNSANHEIWLKFAKTIKFVKFSSYSELIKQVITTGLSRNGICLQHFALPGISLLKLAPSFQEIFALLDSKNAFEQITEKLESDNFKLLEDKLFIRLLEKTLLSDQEIEKFLTFTRKSLLEKFEKNQFSKLPNVFLKFLFALSRNCFYNEYLYEEEKSESISLQQLSTILRTLKNFDSSSFDLPKLKALVALFGCYRPLHRVPFATKLFEIAEIESDPDFFALIQEQVKEPIEEEQISNHIPLLKSISDVISTKVSSQYEENPYPRWKTVDKINPKSAECFEVLIAGCGTGQHAINSAISFPNSHILAIDLSKKSLAYAARKAKELKINNIEFMQADLLDLESLDRTFDQIESVGVLHHLEDPVRGWRVLTKLLKPQGRMEIGLYSELARQDVAAAQTFIKTRGYPSTPEGIKLCRKDIFSLPPSDPIHWLSMGLDFYSLSACRDLLFHVQEQTFTLPRIAAILEELGLKFMGFEMRDQKIIKKYQEQFPDDPQASSLVHWHQFEIDNPQTFTGMYLFHVQMSSQQTANKNL
ncbi:MAG: class I SAM-dependent methyltransferase [Parachlamydiaceae bacterium]|nr:class I SAM-dependent methyltransferase [Parachlamydiaceae bacterium]